MADADMVASLKAAQLLCSRLCHELAGPVIPIGAGIEALQESAARDQETLCLLNDSFQEIKTRLAFYRKAFGTFSETGEAAAEARGLAANMLANGRICLDWPADEALNLKLAAGGPALILNMILLGASALPGKGFVRVRLAGMPEGIGIAVIAGGGQARINADLQMAMSQGAMGVPAASLAPGNIHGYLAAMLAKGFGSGIEISECKEEKNEVRFAALVPRGR